MHKVLKRSKSFKARICKIETEHGKIETPFFMPDATRAAVKYLDNSDLVKLKMGPMVVNTFHLSLQPGLKTVKKAGGVHKFMNWNGPLLSDSGGFQVFSLVHRNPKMGKIHDDRVEFRSPINGSRHTLTPAKSIDIQFALGTDMMVVLDDCPPNDFDEKAIAKSVERTIRWAKECKKEFEKGVKKLKGAKEGIGRPLLFGVIQGGAFKDLRKRCADALIEIGFDGYGFGARPVDEHGNFLADILEYTAGLIPADSLRFGLGMGTPDDILKSVRMGWDMFDCVIPTREGRHGRLFCLCHSRESGNPRFAHQTMDSRLRGNDRNINFSNDNHILEKQKNKKTEKQKCFFNGNFYRTINIANSKFANDLSPINDSSKISELRNYNLAYLHHLFKVKEPLGQRLATLNNLEFYLDIMEKIRYGIRSDLNEH
jgi:queuine tRNA-ribosyltransferase